MRRSGAVAAVLALTVFAAPAAADDDHGVTASCEWFWTGIPESNAVVLRVVAQSHVTGHEGLLTNAVECSVWSATEAVQVSGTNITRDHVVAGGGVVTAASFRRCVRASAQWVTRVDPGVPVPDNHRAEFSDPAGCLPPCHLVPRPPACEPAEGSDR